MGRPGLITKLRRAAGAFGVKSATFRAVMPPGGPPGAGGGSPEFDAALAQVLGIIGGRHIQLAAVIAGHGRKLRETGQDCQAAEKAIGGMIDRILDPGAPG